MLRFARKISSSLRRLPGTYPLINGVRRRAYRLGEQIIEDYDGNLKLKVNLSEHMGSQIFWFGYYSRDVLMALSTFIEPGATFVDAGANLGEITLYAAKRVGRRGRVIAFEPDPRMHARCAHNIGLNKFGDYVRLIDKGLSDRTERRPIYAASTIYKDGSPHDGLGTIYKSGDREKQVALVDLVTLDDYVRGHALDRLDGIKLDIEGAELPALRGAEATLKRFRPWLVIEIGEATCSAAGYKATDVTDYLERFGYRFFDIGRKGVMTAIAAHQLRGYQNVFCLPNKSPAAVLG